MMFVGDWCVMLLCDVFEVWVGDEEVMGDGLRMIVMLCWVMCVSVMWVCE